MRFVIFSGTTEGRQLAQALSEMGAVVTVCVATAYGEALQGYAPGITVHTGRLDETGMGQVLAGAALCVDATHPYAAQVTAQLRNACQTAGVPYRRLLRGKSVLPKGSISVDSAEEAAVYLANTDGNILLTTGAKELEAFASLGGQRLYPRVLPMEESLAACAAAGVPRRNILAMQGPFSQALNMAILRQYQIQWLVTKDGGKQGGFAEKAAAAEAVGAALVVLRRPADSGESYETLLADCKLRLMEETGRTEEETRLQVLLAAMGGGTPEGLTVECARALQAADCILGAKRLLASLPEGCTQNRVEAITAAALLEGLQKAEQAGAKLAVVCYSGDTGFYSGARTLLPKLAAQGFAVQVLPGVSSVQLLAARLGRPWQDWTLVSAHGVDCDPVAAVGQGKPVCFLTGGALGPAQLCARLTKAGLGALSVTVGENLSGPEERISTGTAEAFAAGTFAPLSVLLVEAPDILPRRTPGLPDERFARGAVPMTKQEVRAVVLAKLAITPEDVLWDVGAGTGSVSVELALAANRGQVYAIEDKAEAWELIRKNRESFHAWNLKLVEGRAPKALEGLPPPDGVFIGGSGGELPAIVEAALTANPHARLCISAIALETLDAAVKALTDHGITPQVTQLAVSRSREAGGLHLMMANNPVFLIVGWRDV